MTVTTEQKIHSWEYKLALLPDRMSPMNSEQISAFLSKVFVPSLIRHHLKVAPISAPGTQICTVLFYDTPAPEFSYYDYLESQGSEGGFIIRWREFSPQPPGRTDLTLKLRSTDRAEVVGRKLNSYSSACDDIKFKLELSANSRSSELVTSYALDNELKTSAAGCQFPPAPPDSAEDWGTLFQILRQVGDSAPVLEVNQILVTQTQLQLVNLEFEGVKGPVEGDLIVWENFNHESNGFAQYLAAEFSYSISSSQLESADSPPQVCEHLLVNLRKNAADKNWLAGSMKTASVFYPPTDG